MPRAALLLLILGLPFVGCRNGADDLPPNLVVVVLDTLRPDHLGLYGYVGGTSPHLDAFAEDAFVFDNAQTTAPWTAPALVSLVTSLHPDVHGVRGFPNPSRMSENVVTLTEVLKSHGYRTAAFTEGGYAKGEWGLGQGFDDFPTNPGDEDSNSGNMQDASRLSGNLDRAIAWLGEVADRPFFMLFQTYEPHSPWGAPASVVREYMPDFDEARLHAEARAAVEKWNREQTIDEAGCLVLWKDQHHCRLRGLPEIQNATELWAAAETFGLGRSSAHTNPEIIDWVRRLYDAEVRYADEQMARLWRALDERGVADRTVVAIVSDHGEGLGEHGNLEHGKGLWEELLHIVFLLRVPKHVLDVEPRRIPDLVSLVDVAPTLLDLLAVDSRDFGNQGQSLEPLLTGERGAERPTFSHALSVGVSDDTVASIRSGRWRYVFDEASGKAALYDLEADPDETTDVASDHPDVAAHLHELLLARRSKDRRLREVMAIEPENRPLSPADLKRLTELGYTDDDGGPPERKREPGD